MVAAESGFASFFLLASRYLCKSSVFYLVFVRVECSPLFFLLLLVCLLLFLQCCRFSALDVGLGLVCARLDFFLGSVAATLSTYFLCLVVDTTVFLFLPVCCFACFLCVFQEIWSQCGFPAAATARTPVSCSVEE